jgi:amidohydrolase
MFEGKMASSAQSTAISALSGLVSHLTGQLDEFRSWRRDIHAHPEIAFEEFRTARIVAEKLRSFGIDTTEGIAATGVVGRLSNGVGPAIGLRADLDALPMEEQNGFEHRSKHAGCFHGCGHDGHTVMLLAAARYLSETRKFQGTINFIFQPAEESAGGGRVMVEEGLFDRFPCDQVYALHNWPSLPNGCIAVRSGAVMASTDRWDLNVIGKGGHAAFPHQTVDPILVGAHIVAAWQALVSRELSPTTPAVVSVTKFHAGSAYNVIPERAVLSGTVRALGEDIRAQLKRRLLETAQGLGSALGAKIELDYVSGYPCTVNDERCAEFAASVARGLVGEQNVLGNEPPSMGAEDFAYLAAVRPGAYIWLGQADATHTAGLHNPRYDFNDTVLPLGAALHVALAETYLRAN